MRRDIFDIARLITEGHNLDEALSEDDRKRMRSELGTAEMKPCDFDVTIDAWLHRISLWGKTKIIHIDPEFKEKKEVTPDQFIKQMFDDNLLKAFGQWHIEELAFNKIKIYRKYRGLLGKEFTEEFIVENDLSGLQRRAR